MKSAGTAAKQTGWKRSAAIWLGLTALTLTGLLARSETPTSKGVLRSRVYKLQYIDSSAARTFLERLKIGTDYNTLSSEVIIVTSDRPQDLIKATSVLAVADAETPVEVRPLMAPTEAVPAPSAEELAVRLKTLTIGTLTDAPVVGAGRAAIVDMAEGVLIGIAAPDVLAEIETAIRAWKQEHSPAPQVPVFPTDPNAGPKPSLSEVAAQVFGESTETAVAADPNAVEPAAQEPNEPEASTPTEPAPAEKGGLEQLRESVQQGSDPAATGESIKDALMALIASRKAQQQAEQTQPQEPSNVAETTEPSEPAGAEKPSEPTPSVGPGKIVTRPTLTEAKAEEELELTITLPEEVEIEALLELVGKQLGLNYMYDPTILRGQKVMLKIHDGVIKVKDLYALLESVLRFRGFVMTRRDQLVTIARQDQISSLDPVIRQPDEPIQPGDVVVSSVFELKNIDVNTARTMLTQIKLGTDIYAIPETGTLIVTDYAYRMPRIREVLSMIDVAGVPKDFRFRQLKYMQASELTPKVKALSTQIEGVTVTVAGQPTAPTMVTRTQIDPQTRRPVQVQVPAPPAGGAAAPTGAATPETVYLEADERTNRVLMIGYPDQLELVNQLVDSLDVPGYDLRFIREYIIQYVEATDVITVLNELGLAQVSVTTGRPGQMTTPGRTTMQPTRPGQPVQPTPQPTPMIQPAATGDISQPYISLRSATNSLLVNATDEQHKAIEMVITHVDVMQKDQRTIKEYEIQNVDAQSILDTLADLGIITPKTTTASGPGARSSATTTAGRPGQAGVGAPAEVVQPMILPTAEGTEREITAQEPQIALLPTTNSLLVHATPRQHAAIALVIAHADRQLDQMSAPYVVYALENQDPEELAEVLNKLIQETVEEKTAGATTASAPDARIQTKTTGTTILPSGEEQRIRILPDPKTYSLIVYANKRNQQWVGDLIRELDEYRPQVLLDCTLVEVTEDDAFKYELDLVSKTYDDLTLRPGVSGSIGGNATSIGNVGGSTSFDSLTYAHGSTGGGIFTGYFNSDMIQGMLTAMQEKGYGRIMSRPKVLVNDNQEGEIKTENIRPVAQAKTNVIPGTASQASTATTDVSFVDYTAGVTLTITPHISKGDMLRLDITLNRTDFSENDPVEIKETDNSVPPKTITKSYPSPPDRISTDLTTVSTVPDGTTIILGGLETINQGKIVKKVPILGDLPLLGGLFRDVSNSGKQSKLYVFVRAHIIRPSDQAGGIEDIQRVSGKYREEFEKMEKKLQDMPNWPGVKPQPMEPERVLEKD